MFYFEDEISTFQVHKRQTRQYHIWEKEIFILILSGNSFFNLLAIDIILIALQLKNYKFISLPKMLLKVL